MFELPERMKKFGVHVVESEEEWREITKIDKRFSADEDDEDEDE